MPQHWYRRQEDRAVAWILTELWRPKPGGTSPMKADVFCRAHLRLLFLSIPLFLLTFMGQYCGTIVAIRPKEPSNYFNEYSLILIKIRSNLFRGWYLPNWIVSGTSIKCSSIIYFLSNGFTANSGVFLRQHNGDNCFSHNQRTKSI